MVQNDIIESNLGSEDEHYAVSLQELSDRLRIQQEELFKQQRDLLSQEALRHPSTGSSNTFSFTQGLILGQLSVILVVSIFIKFFVFQDASNVSSTSSAKDATGVLVKRDKKNKTPGIESEDQDDIDLHARNIATILEKTYYNVDNHASESLDWFNVLIAQTISQLRTEALISDNIFHSLNDFLTKSDFPDYLDTVKITEIDIGDDFPIFSNCRIKQSQDGSGRLEAKIDVDLSDTITLGIETRLLINHPRPMIASLPIQLSVSLVRFSGCLAVSLFSPNDEKLMATSGQTETTANSATSTTTAATPAVSGDVALTTAAVLEPLVTSPLKGTSNGSKKTEKKAEIESGTAIRFSFSPDYRLEFNIKSLIGSRAKLQDVPKISSLIEARLKQWFVERSVEPRFQVIRIPSLWPRSKNTREAVADKTD
ncbi:ERMES complex subunit mmm1 [Yamadazyma tenuis]|uniref:ERMES complex subunit mmm1 n=1 Tax=Candida tenuis TaxID=2315449 RepID=UPI002798F527|nr:ERMES complex subunit mmm1 [Yamadazyma tenuis]